MERSSFTIDLGAVRRNQELDLAGSEALLEKHQLQHKGNMSFR